MQHPLTRLLSHVSNRYIRVRSTEMTYDRHDGLVRDESIGIQGLLSFCVEGESVRA